MDPFRRQRIPGRRGLRGARRRRCGRNSASFVHALKGNAPDTAALIVRNIQGPIRPDRQAGRAVCRAAWLFERPSETVSENDERPRSLTVFQWLKHDIVAALRFGRPVPGSMEGNEGAVFVGGRELAALVDEHVIGRPVRRERRDRCFLLRTDAH